MPYALITGASRGIGKGIAIELAKRNYDLLLTARSEELLNKTAEEIKKKYAVTIAIYPVDLSECNASQKLYDWCLINNYRISVLINNAGFGLSGYFESHSLQQNTDLIAVNIIAPTHLCHLFIPMLKQNPQSYILNICSSSAYQAVPMLTIYSATKAYIRSFTRGLRHELKDFGISVTCLSPGPTDTDWVNTAKIGKRAIKVASKLHMQPELVASIAVKAMFKRKAEVIVGFINKLGAFFAWLLPNSFVEKNASRIYKD